MSTSSHFGVAPSGSLTQELTGSLSIAISGLWPIE